MNTKTLSIPGVRGAKVNVGPGERMISVFAGGALAVAAMRQRNWTAAALAAGGSALLWRGLSGNCPAYSAAGINRAEAQHTSQHVEHAVTIDAPAERIYEFWRNLENLPRVMKYLDSVQVLDDRRSIWRAKGPMDKTVEWEAEIVNDLPNRRIEWQSVANASVANSGWVEFRPASGRSGTEVHVSIDYQPPAGSIGEGIAKLTGRSPEREVREDLRRLKMLIEAGEVATIEGQSALHRKSMLAPFSSSSK